MNHHPVPVGGMFAFVLAASLASTIGGLPFNALPVLLGSLATHLPWSRRWWA